MVVGRLKPVLKWDNEWPSQDSISPMLDDNCTIIDTCKRFLFSGIATVD